MTMESTLVALLAGTLFVYLLWTLLRAEKL